MRKADEASGVASGTRRDFLYLATGAVAAIGAASAAWPFIDQMNPDAATLAQGEPIDVDLAKLDPGQQVTVMWRGRPVFVVHRTPEVLATLQDPRMIARLADPQSTARQQPDYARNWHRSIKPEHLIVVGICTHLGCIPDYRPQPGSVEGGWLGGYLCPCHGSKYDLAGRVYDGVPAPLNLPVPPYRYAVGASVTVGVNPTGSDFDFGSIEQL
jgi:ubiquinol-cytochrome c reductase iron-sulfur subunit